MLASNYDTGKLSLTVERGILMKTNSYTPNSKTGGSNEKVQQPE